MTSQRKLERLPILLPELDGYLVDSGGQVWRVGKSRRGRDLPLKGMRFTQAVHGWEDRVALTGNRVLRLMPGVWKWCPDPTPGAAGDRLHRQGDWLGFSLYHLRGLDAESRVVLHNAAKPECRSWFVIRPRGEPRSPLLIEGQTAYLALLQSQPGATLRSL
jgi:hypothetical protein